MRVLKKKYKCNSLKEARQLLKKKVRARDALQEKIERQIAEFERQLAENSETSDED